MTLLIGIIIYIIGYILAYLLGKWDWKDGNRIWTVGDRKFYLKFCLSSWLLFFVLISIIWERKNWLNINNWLSTGNDDKPAK